MYNIGYQIQNGNGNKWQDKNVLIFHSQEDEPVTASAISVSYAGFLTNHKCNLIIGRPVGTLEWPDGIPLPFL